ncbi:hypothetical protein [Microvirga tunisiensis]|uniref:Uncharacterized protein n=1 Tax=Microvirga tunisiensis TaxID=2108360 RepID=A0A5N7N6V4_9HYPH|nr:hypothetical protein [Microvirga tunisiensis]MPR12938.1 hypothetical protein [Microvirga tunisiensis]MPR30866.1 hypothetical protein [Microvirga tunisiensis]
MSGHQRDPHLNYAPKPTRSSSTHKPMRCAAGTAPGRCRVRPLAAAWQEAGFQDIGETTLTIRVDYADFEDFRQG